MSLEDVKRLARDYMNVDAMNYLVVGDAETQAAGTVDLGFGYPIMLNTDE